MWYETWSNVSNLIESIIELVLISIFNLFLYRLVSGKILNFDNEMSYFFKQVCDVLFSAFAC